MPDIYLGLDYGRKKIGLAVATPLGTVHPRPRLDRTTPEDDFARLRAIAEEAGATALVIGLPHHMDGSESEMEREARGFATRLGRACGLPVYGSDERLTTEAAETILKARRLHGRKRRERRDSAAACLLLADFLQAEDKKERIA